MISSFKKIVNDRLQPFVNKVTKWFYAQSKESRHLLVLAALVVGMMGIGIGVGVFVGRAIKTNPPTVAFEPAHTGDDRNGPTIVVPTQPSEVSVTEAVPTPTNKPVPTSSPLKIVGQPAWRRYAVPFTATGSKPKIAIIIDDLGLDRRRTNRAIELPPPLTMAFLTYAEDLPAQTEIAHKHGHELLVHMPMQAMSSHFNAGPNTLEVGLSEQELQTRIQWGLSRFTGFVGVNNHMGSRFTSDADGMDVVMRALKRSGLLFLDSVTTDVSQGPAAAKREGVPFLQRQVFLDNEQTQESINHQLAETEEIARRHGQAIAIGHPHDATISALSEWLPTLAAKGFEIVPLTALMKEKKS